MGPTTSPYGRELQTSSAPTRHFLLPTSLLSSVQHNRDICMQPMVLFDSTFRASSALYDRRLTGLQCLKFSTWLNWHQQMALSRALKCPTLPLLCLPGKGHLALLFFLRGGSLPALFLRLLPPLRVVGLPYLVQGNSSLLLRTKTELTTSPLVKLAASTKGGISL